MTHLPSKPKSSSAKTMDRMGHAYYRDDGPRKDLQDCGALIRLNPDDEETYLVQFDALFLREAYGWHVFPKTDFKNLEWYDEIT